jgi:flavodoxin
VDSLVIYDSKFGNTQHVAEIIAKGLEAAGPVRVLGVDAIPVASLGNPDLLVIGGPRARPEPEDAAVPGRAGLQGSGAPERCGL